MMVSGPSTGASTMSHRAPSPGPGSKLLKPGGRVISLVFPIESSMRTSAIQLVRYYMAGPPYTISTALVEQLLNAEADYETEHCSAEHPHLAGNPMGATSALLVLKKK